MLRQLLIIPFLFLGIRKNQQLTYFYTETSNISIDNRCNINNRNHIQHYGNFN